MVFLGWFLNENDLNMFAGYGAEEVEDFKGMRERERAGQRSWSENGLLVPNPFRVGSVLGHSKLPSAHLLMCLKTLHYLPTTFR